MLKLQTNGVFGATTSYASTQNARFSISNSRVCSIQQRWNDTFNSLPLDSQKLVTQTLSSSVAEFKRRNPNIKKWSQLQLAEAKNVLMAAIQIDSTMQRQLNIFWVLTLLNKFLATMVVPIQVYRPVPGVDNFLAWDGQHTLVLLWLISQILGEDINTIEIPVNIYQSSLKAQMRGNFVDMASKEGRMALDQYDIYEQMVFGVRIDGSTNPLWIAAEQKQQVIENYGLFVTSKKFNNHTQPGAISRLQEINKLTPESVDALCYYLSLSTKLQRPVGEKEMVMMAHYFLRCGFDNIKLDAQYINDLATVTETLWQSDFDPSGKFWEQAGIAYNNWHALNNNAYATARFNKEPIHGFPFLIAQLNKSFAHPTPRSDSNSNFWPAAGDLF